MEYDYEVEVWCGHNNAVPGECPANFKAFGAHDECFCCANCRHDCEMD